MVDGRWFEQDSQETGTSQAHVLHSKDRLRWFLACACAFDGFLLWFLLVSTGLPLRLFATSSGKDHSRCLQRQPTQVHASLLQVYVSALRST